MNFALSSIQRIRPAVFWSGLFGLALALRLAFLIFWEQESLVRLYPYDSYHTIALSWLGWHPPTDLAITHPPLYPAFLASVYWITGSSAGAQERMWIVGILQCILSGATCLLVAGWVRGFEPESVARWTALWLALDLPMIVFAPQLQSETLFIFLNACFFWLLYKSLRADSPLLFFLSGLLGALATLCRGAWMAYLPFLLLCIVFRRVTTRGAFFLALGWALPILGWTLRNLHYYHVPVPISIQAGWNLYEGLVASPEEVQRRPHEMAEEAQRLGLKRPLEVDRHFKDKALKWISKNPLQAARLFALKFFKFWRPWPYPPYSGWVRAVLGFYFFLLFGMAVLGTFSRGLVHRELIFVYAFFLSLTLLHTVFFSSLRYRLPLEPFLCYLGAVGLGRFLPVESEPTPG